MSLRIRPAAPADAAALLAIYAPVVRDTAISFEEVPPSVEEFEGRIRKVAQKWAWLVAEREGRVIGYAYGSVHRERAAYRFSTETTAYIAADARGQGVGRRLYEALFPVLEARGFCNAFAGVALPNAASVALHQAVGFEPIGVFPKVGWKFGQWHDVAWFCRSLREGSPEDGR